MTNEAVIIELLGDKGDPVRFTVADGTGIEKGTIMKLADTRTASAASADGDFFAGIAAAEKVANDGATTLALYTKGIFDLFCNSSVSVPVGNRVKISGANMVVLADEDIVEKGQEVCGVALETHAAGTDETIAVAVGVYT